MGSSDSGDQFLGVEDHTGFFPWFCCCKRRKAHLAGCPLLGARPREQSTQCVRRHQQPPPDPQGWQIAPSGGLIGRPTAKSEQLPGFRDGHGWSIREATRALGDRGHGRLGALCRWLPARDELDWS